MSEPLREGKIVDTEEFIDDGFMLLPNSGDIAEIEDEKQTEESEDKVVFGGDPKIIEMVFEWMENEIKDCDSITAAISLSKEYNIPMETALIALKTIHDVFLIKKVSWENLYDTLKK